MKSSIYFVCTIFISVASLLCNVANVDAGNRSRYGLRGLLAVEEPSEYEPSDYYYEVYEDEEIEGDAQVMEYEEYEFYDEDEDLLDLEHSTVRGRHRALTDKSKSKSKSDKSKSKKSGSKSKKSKSKSKSDKSDKSSKKSKSKSKSDKSKSKKSKTCSEKSSKSKSKSKKSCKSKSEKSKSKSKSKRYADASTAMGRLSMLTQGVDIAPVQGQAQTQVEAQERNRVVANTNTIMSSNLAILANLATPTTSTDTNLSSGGVMTQSQEPASSLTKLGRLDASF